MNLWWVVVTMLVSRVLVPGLWTQQRRLSSKTANKWRTNQPPKETTTNTAWLVVFANFHGVNRPSNHRPFQAINMMSMAGKTPEKLILSRAINMMSMVHTNSHTANQTLPKCWTLGVSDSGSGKRTNPTLSHSRGKGGLYIVPWHLHACEDQEMAWLLGGMGAPRCFWK